MSYTYILTFLHDLQNIHAYVYIYIYIYIYILFIYYIFDNVCIYYIYEYIDTLYR